MKKEFMIQGMSCGGCKKNVESLARSTQGVLDVEVDLPTGKTVLEVDDSFELEQFAQAIDDAGFEIQ